MHSLKYTIYNSYDEESNMPLLASIHLLKSYDPKIKEEIGINYTYRLLTDSRNAYLFRSYSSERNRADRTRLWETPSN